MSPNRYPRQVRSQYSPDILIVVEYLHRIITAEVLKADHFLGPEAENKRVLAAGYKNAKLTIKLINAVGDVINNDPAIGGKIKVVFIDSWSLFTCTSKMERGSTSIPLCSRI